jgi:serine protease Do
MKTLPGFAVLVLLLLVIPADAQEAAKEEPNPLAKLEEAFQKAAETVKEIVVSIDVERDPNIPETEREEQERLKPVLGREAQGRPGKYYHRPNGPVSGVVISSDGYIITSFFNVRGKNIKSMKVTFPAGFRLGARLVGYDENTDIALLKVHALDLKHVEFSASDHLKAGHFAIVVGRGEDRLSLTVNSGVISATKRLEGRAMQIDSALNYGNTGGAVVDIEGKLVGIACQVSDRAVTGQNSGVGFMTPAEKLKEIIPELKKGKIIEKEKKPFLGVAASEGATDVEGAHVSRVMDNTPAAEAGMQDGDIIVEFNGVKIKDWDSLRDAISKTKVGDKVKVKVKRADKEVELEVTVGERP